MSPSPESPSAAPDPRSGPPSSSAPSRGRALLVLAALVAGLAYAPTRPVVVTLLALLGLVAAHEAGHLAAAKRAGVAAEEFAVGFGPLLWQSRPRRGTVFSWRAVPLGGFVRIEGLSSRPGSGSAPQGLSFQEVSRLRRIWIVVAGPAANLAVTAACLLVLFASLGVPTPTTTVEVLAGSPAERAGLVSGDRVLAAGGSPVESWEEVSAALADAGAALPVVVERGSERLELVLHPDPSGRVGLLAVTESSPLPPRTAITETVLTTGRFAKVTVASVTDLGASLLAVPAQLSGVADTDSDGLASARPVSPIGAARIAEESAATQGAAGPILLLAVASMFMAVFNLLPVPPLDGGHVAVLVYEGVASRLARRPVVVDPARLAPVAAMVVALVVTVGLSSILLDVVRPLGG